MSHKRVAPRRLMRLIVTAAILVTWASPAAGQQHQHEPPAATGWTWSPAARVFLGANFQVREFTDFHQIESQNWFMGEGARRVGRGTFVLHGMLSLEPLTLRRLGSAQVFQTGETLDDAPLVDYQHPHDLFMALEARYGRPVGERARVWASGAPVGAAAFGPTAFMHRTSAADNPTAPLAHHYIDSTHISRSVVSLGFARGPLVVDGSIFKGREPDENRWDLDLGVPDSWSARVAWARGHWRAQFSGGRWTSPESIEPFMDVVKLSISAEYDRTYRGRPLSMTLAVGRNRESYGDLDGALFEAALRPSSAYRTYFRAEVVEKNILTAGGLHPPGFTHPHIFSTVAAFTAGLARDIASTRAGLFSAGADFTAHIVPANLQDSYGTKPTVATCQPSPPVHPLKSAACR